MLRVRSPSPAPIASVRFSNGPFRKEIAVSVQTVQTKTSKTIQEEDTMTQTSATQLSSEQATDNTTIRPFHFEAPQVDLADLRKRIAATKGPARQQLPDPTHSLQLTTMQQLAPHC